MASYNEWNKAITEHFVSVPAGETIYLSVDSDVLNEIGQRAFGEIIEADWVEDFEAAVRGECVKNGQIDLSNIYGIGPDGVPRGVAFLAAMVLAAHRMAEEDDEEEKVSDTNYFTRLQEVFGFNGKGRPPGLREAGVEVPLWETWNHWIIEKGWLPSAEKGRDQVNRYINYPISQSLLREGDKERLERRLRQSERAGRLKRTWDQDRLGTWLRVNADQFTPRHLQALIREPDPRHYEAVVDAIYNVYASVDWEQETTYIKRTGAFAMQRRLSAGLYRNEDALSGVITYHLYPRQPKHKQGGTSLRLLIEDEVHVLREDRPGWFVPLPWDESLAGGTLYELQGDPCIKQLVMPERGFWILVRDPESEESGIFASWGTPQIGQTFLLLCQKKYADQLQILSEENLVTWDQEFPLTGLHDGWVEYREFMVISPYWKGIIPREEDLYEALRPQLSATITLTGGLRVSDKAGGGWLEGMPPEIKVTAFNDWPVRLNIQNITDPDENYIELESMTNKPIRNLPPLQPGVYLLQVSDESQHIPPQRLRIVGWEVLECLPPKHPFSSDCGEFSLQGAVIKVKEGVYHEEGL
jgi:hypothetical protein